MVFFESNLYLNKNAEEILQIGTALSSPVRIEILKIINNDVPVKLYELSKFCHVSISSIQFHVNILCKAKLAKIETIKKNKKEIVFVRSYTKVLNLTFLDAYVPTNNLIGTLSIPVGNYSLVDGYTRGALLLPDATPVDLFSIDSYKAIVVWIDKGAFKYLISNSIFTHRKIEAVEIGFESCSEAPGFNKEWPSDITCWINDIELCTYTCKGDYGGRKGRYTPDAWSNSKTQYGEWNVLRIDENGTYLNGNKVSEIKVENLNLHNGDYFSLKIGNKDDAKNKGGINIMGKGFGDYDANIEISVFGQNE